MDSLVQTGMLRKLYDEALQGEEIKPSAFWQLVLQWTFTDPNKYTVTILPVSHHLRCMDALIERYDASTDRFCPIMVWMEGIGSSEFIKSIESQALDAAKCAMERDGHDSMWAITTFSVSFRLWFVRKDSDKLVPVSGTSDEGDIAQYVDAGANTASILFRVANLIKADIPLQSIQNGGLGHP